MEVQEMKRMGIEMGVSEKLNSRWKGKEEKRKKMQKVSASI